MPRPVTSPHFASQRAMPYSHASRPSQTTAKSPSATKGLKKRPSNAELDPNGGGGGGGETSSRKGSEVSENSTAGNGDREHRKKSKRSKHRAQRSGSRDSSQQDPGVSPRVKAEGAAAGSDGLDNLYQRYMKQKAAFSRSPSAVSSPKADRLGKSQLPFNTSPTTLPAPAKNAKKNVELAATQKQQQQGDYRVQLMERQMKNMRDESERETAELRAKIEELEKTVKRMTDVESEKVKEVQASKLEAILTHQNLIDTLKDAVTCQVCFEPLNDPHILSCGHIACKQCFIQFFRTPGAYFHNFENIEPDADLSYFRKMCHVCREPVIDRPARMYHFRGILGPLGIDPLIPSPSQSRAERDTSQDRINDPWRNIFPPLRDSYRIYDEADNVQRCYECHGEVDFDQCASCGRMYSEHGSVMGDNDGSDDSVPLVFSDGEEESGSDVSDGLGRRLLRRDRQRALRRAREEEAVAAIMRGDPIPELGRRLGRGGRGGNRDDAIELDDDDDETDEDNVRQYVRDRQERQGHLMDLAGVDDDALGDGGDYPDDPDSEEDGSEEESYEGSFIDDEEIDAGHYGSDDDDDASEQDGSDDESAFGGTVESDVEAVEPETSVEYRGSRAAPGRGVAPRVRRAYVDPDEDSD